jgi:hypothetical protein
MNTSVKAADDFKVTVHGFEIKSNTIYQVIPKPDEDAPDGFRRERTTKMLSPRISENVGCVKNPSSNTWDTGFYLYSPCYNKLPMEKRQAIVENVVKNIKEPIENLYGGDNRLDQNNDEFWDEYSFELRNGAIFNTAEPKDLLNLYMAILHGTLAPKDQASTERFKQASYCVVNKNEVIDRKLSRDLNYNKAVGSFFALLENDKSTLVGILNYIGLPARMDTDEVTLNNTVTNFLKNKQSGDQNTEIFLDAFKIAKTEKGKEEIQIYQNLKELAKKGVIRKEGSVYKLGEESLGATFKIAAKTVAGDQTLQEKLIDLLD